MALIDRVRARFSAQRLIELTNQDNRTASSINMVVLGNACSDAQYEFEVLSGNVYDDSNPRHVYVAVYGVFYYLNLWRGIEHDKLEQIKTKWEKMCEDLAKVTHRNRIQPRSNSVLVPSREEADGEIVRPDFDRDLFDGFIPRGPEYNRDSGRPGVEDI